jgi:hypothetical protein
LGSVLEGLGFEADLAAGESEVALLGCHVGIIDELVCVSALFDIHVDGGGFKVVAVDLVAQLGREAEERRLLLVELGVRAVSVSAW